MPYLDRENNTPIQKLEFYLMVYFSIYPIHATNPAKGDLDKLNNEMQKFKTYIETQGARLSKTPEFLSFYALPYIKDLQVIR